MRQLLYVSSKAPREEVSVGNILTASRRNNDAAGVTGLLYTDGQRFLQVLEGEAETVEVTFQRIRRDSRHHAVVVLSDRQIGEREFGAWSMAHRQASDASDMFDTRMSRMLSGASEAVRGTFTGLIAARHAA
jgi:hypothetical protein